MRDKVAIIGAGPAGIACAVQLKRYGISPLLFEKSHVGGLLRNANLVENYLGFENGISGQILVENFSKHLEKLDIKPVFEEVTEVSFEKFFTIKTAKNTYQPEILVVASGTKPKKLQFCHCEEAALLPTKQSKSEINNNFWIASGKSPRNDDQTLNKIFYEIADLPEDNYSGKKFAVIGSGDAAFDYAINLVNNYHASEVIILNRNNRVKCLPLLEERAILTGKIKHIKNIVPDEKMLNDFDYIIVAIGREADKDFLDESLLKISPKLEQEGSLYFIGDVINGDYRQISISAGDGIKAAMKIYVNIIS